MLSLNRGAIGQGSYQNTKLHFYYTNGSFKIWELNGIWVKAQQFQSSFFFFGRCTLLLVAMATLN